MASKQAQKRLMKEQVEMNKAPPPFIIARPRENNILEWHYIMRGPPGTPYHGGEYWGTVTFPPEYPFKPPSIVMITPSGRFQCNARICTSMSDYHPDSWNPSWSVSSILTGLLSFMVSNEHTMGGITNSDCERQRLARETHNYNVSHLGFRTIFPEYANSSKMVDLPNMG